MAMGKRPVARQASPLWVETADLPTSDGHPFFERLNRVLEDCRFDAFVEGLCSAFYAARMGRPSLRPGRYFRMLLIGYFEGLSSERGIAWRVADSLSLRSFLDLELTESAPDHSTLSRTRRLIDVETHEAVFTWFWSACLKRGLVVGKTVGIDATTLEANAAMRSTGVRPPTTLFHGLVGGIGGSSGAFATGPQADSRGHVSSPRSPNPAGRFPAPYVFDNIRCFMLRSRLCGELDEISHRSWRRRRSSPHNAKDYRAAGNRQFTVRVPVGRVFRQGTRTGNGACLQRLCLHFQVHTRRSDWSSRGRRVPAMRAHRQQGNHHARFIYVVKLLAAMRLSKRLRQLRHIT